MINLRNAFLLATTKEQLYNPRSQKIVTCMDVCFDENDCYDYSNSSELSGWQNLNLEEELLEHDTDDGIEPLQPDNDDCVEHQHN